MIRRDDEQKAVPAPSGGMPPPQQARSRAALQRILGSAEEVLVKYGLPEFTIARVAEHAGVSVGGVYRRFENKDQLIDAVRRAMLERLKSTAAEAITAEHTSLAALLDATTAALTDLFAKSGQVIPVMLAGGHTSEDARREGADTLATIQRTFLEAGAAHHREIAHDDPDAALAFALRGIVATGAHRAATAPWWPDGNDWSQWSRETARMATAYLTASAD